MAWKFQILNPLNLFRQKADRSDLTNEKYIPFFGGNDNFPLEWSKIISESPSGASCLSTVQDFLKGHGFSDPDLETLKINAKGQTLFQVHHETADSFGQFDGFYWLIRYSAAGTVSEIEVLPFENCRLGQPDDNGWIQHIYYNPFFGTDKYKGVHRRQTKCYDVFHPPAVRAQQLEQGSKYKGQVLFVGTTSPLSRFYPIPYAYSCKKWMKTETGVADYHEDNINNGFLQPYMLIMKGDPNQPSSNPDYQNVHGDKPATVGEEFDDVMAKNFMGAKRVGNVYVQWVSQTDEKPEVVQLPSNNNGDLFITLDNQATKKITVAWKVVAILANIQEGASLGGDGNQIRVAVKLMQQRAVPKQRILTDTYEMVLKLMARPYTNEITITPYNPYPELEVLDDKIWEAMTDDERRKWINDNTEIEIGEDLVDTTQNPATTARVSNAIPVAFPENVRKTVQKTMEYIEKMDIKCGGQGGRDVANEILNNKSMGFKQLKRIHSYLKKNNHLENSPYNEGCDVILYNQWGGKQMFDFLETKLQDLDQWLNK